MLADLVIQIIQSKGKALNFKKIVAFFWVFYCECEWKNVDVTFKLKNRFTWEGFPVVISNRQDRRRKDEIKR